MMSTAHHGRRRGAYAIAVLILAAALSGCSSAIDHIPTALGGLPDGTPQRPAAAPAYPAVHDMPPARQDTALSEEERKRLRQDLAEQRDQTKAAEATGATPPAGTTRKK
ncbi:MAG: hypothetical protein ACRECO_03860 [Xanthobacteraceae bacterium]